MTTVAMAAALQRPTYWQAAKQHLAAADPVLARLIEQYHGEEGLVNRGDAYQTLCRAIVGQQISVKAADAVWAKFTQLGAVQPAVTLGLTEDALRGVGLSRQKVQYVQGIARGFVAGTVHPHQWQDWGDDAIQAELVKLPGIGPWTAQMFLIFHLLRPDVLPILDLGLLKGFEVYHQQPRTALPQYAERWRPYRTVATWYLWRALDPVPVAY